MKMFAHFNEDSVCHNTPQLQCVKSVYPILGHALLSHLPLTTLLATNYFQQNIVSRYINSRPIPSTIDINYQYYVVANQPQGVLVQHLQVANPTWTSTTTDNTTLIDQLCLNGTEPYQLSYLNLPATQLRDNTTPLDVIPTYYHNLFGSCVMRYNVTVHEFAVPQDVLEVHAQPFVWCGNSFFAVLASGWNYIYGVKVGFIVVSAPTCVPANAQYIDGQVHFMIGYYK